MTRRIFLSSGEFSSEMHTEMVLRAFAEKYPGRFEFFGLGGRLSEAAGLRLVENIVDRAVIGFSEAAKNLWYFYRLLKRIDGMMAQKTIDGVLLIDYPGLNIHIARLAAKHGIPAVFYISPQVWAWRAGRAKKLAQWVKKMLVLFPFEVPIYERVGCPVEHVGHPLVDRTRPRLDRTAARRTIGLSDADRLITLLPGSRRQEVMRHFPVMWEAAKLLARERPLTVAIAVAPTIPPSVYQIWTHDRPPNLKPFIVQDEASRHNLVAASDLALVTTGTTTVETMLLGTPMIAGYKLSGFSYRMAKLFVNVKFCAMPNILADKLIVPEMIQERFTASALAAEADRILSSPEESGRIRDELRTTAQMLGGPGAAMRVADAAAEVLGAGPRAPGARTSETPIPSLRRRLFGYLSAHRNILTAGVLCMVVYAVFHAASLLLMKPVLDNIFFTQQEKLSFVIPYVNWHFDFVDRMAFLTFIAVSIGVTYFVKSTAQFGQEYLMTRAGMRILQRLRNDLFAKFTRLPIEFLEGERAGRILSVSLNDVGLVYTALLRLVTDTVLQPMVILFLVLLAVSRVPVSLSIAAFVVLPGIAVLILFFGRKMKRATHRAQGKIEDLTQVLSEKVAGMKIVRIFGQEQAEQTRFAREVEGHFKWSMRQAMISSLSGPLMMFLGGLGVAATVYYGGHLVVRGTVTTGDFGVFIAAVISIYKPVKSLMNLNNTYQQGEAAAERIFGFMDAPEAADLDVGSEAKFEREISFENLSFQYGGMESDVLSGVNLTVWKGEHVAFVGVSGIGKTTLLMLIPRLLEPTGGRICLDGVPLSGIRPRSLRGLMAAVVQDVVLFNDTVEANIRYGRPDATREDVEAAAKAADAHEFILGMSDGYDTIIGDRGSKLSGGQRQRISIARAFLKNAPILILDEATSNLDSESERQVQDAVIRLSEGRTTLVVAHRLSTVRHCDRIFLLQNGRVADSGSHDELMGRSDAYRAAVALQSL